MAKAVYDRKSQRDIKKSSELRDIYIRHGINLTRYSTHEARKLQGILDTANTQIKNIITKAKAIETKEKYYRVAAEIKRITNELTEKLDRQLEFDFKELAEEETRFVEKAMRSVNVNAELDIPSPTKIWAAASFKNYSEGGHETFETYMDGLSENLYKTWDTNVRAGYLAGLTAQQINRNVLGFVKDLDPGQMQVLRKSLERNTRTMVASMAEEARDATYKANSRLFSGYRYVGTLDSRTCLVCGELDGKVFETLEEAPKLPQHHNCRCLYLPEIKGMEGFDEDDERASVDGPVSANMTYEKWLKTQDDETVKDILGPTRFEMYKNGEPITAFVADGRTLTLEELDKSDVKIENDSLPDKSFLKTAQSLDDLVGYASQEWGIKNINLEGLDASAIKGTFEAMDAVFKEFPEFKGQIIEIGQKKQGIMCATMTREGGLKINFNPGYYSNIEKVKAKYDEGLAAGYYPKGTNWINGGVHELGHIAHGIIAKNNKNYQYAWQASLDWEDHTTAERIVSEAWENAKNDYPKGTKMVSAAKGISGYADFRAKGNTYSETVAEAFSDVFSNRANAQPLSLEIVRILKKDL
jgi:SPP1 gp7 family putative phage head morphogenesis protein